MMAMAIRSTVRGSYQVHIGSRLLLDLHLRDPSFEHDPRRTLFDATEDEIGLYTRVWHEAYRINPASDIPITLDESTLDARIAGSMGRIEEASNGKQAQDDQEPQFKDQEVKTMEAVEDIHSLKDRGSAELASTMPWSAPNVFHRFSELAIELQKEIWDAAMRPWKARTYTAYNLSHLSWALTILLPPWFANSDVKWLWVCQYTRKHFIRAYGHPHTTNFFFNPDVDILRISSHPPPVSSEWTAELRAKALRAWRFFSGLQSTINPDESTQRGRKHLELYRALKEPDKTPSALYRPIFHGLHKTVNGSREGGPQAGQKRLMSDAQGKMVHFSKKPQVLVLGSIPKRVSRVHVLDDSSLCYILDETRLATPSKIEHPRHSGIRELTVQFKIFHGPWGIPLEDLRAVIANYLEDLRKDGDIGALRVMTVLVTIHAGLTWPMHLNPQMVNQWLRWVRSDDITGPMIPFLPAGSQL